MGGGDDGGGGGGGGVCVWGGEIISYLYRKNLVFEYE